MSTAPSHLQRRLAEALIAVSLVAIAALTLGSAPARGVPAGPRIVVFGSLSDLLRNVALYLPLGVGLALRGASTRLTWLGGFGLSAAIELSQLAIPGRASSPDDCLANALGAGLGLALARTAPRWLSPTRASARRLEHSRSGSGSRRSLRRPSSRRPRSRPGRGTRTGIPKSEISSPTPARCKT